MTRELFRFFENEVLSKEFILGSTGDPASKSSLIQWKEGHDLTAKSKVTGGSGSIPGSRKRSSVPDKPSFFGWFSDNSEPAADEIAEVIKDDMWPNPLQYFLVPDIEVENGENEEDEDDDDEDDDEEEDDEIDEDEDNVSLCDYYY